MDAYKSNQIPQWRTFLYSLCITVGYVGILYIKKDTRPSSNVSRDDPKVMKQRMILVTIFTLFVTFIVVPGLLVMEKTYDNWFVAFSSLRILWGWRSHGGSLFEILVMILLLVYDVIRAIGLTAILFSGPLVNYLIFEHKLKVKAILKDMKKGISDIYGLRNYIVGPITEEFVFRASIISLYLVTGHSWKDQIIYLTPLYFGVAHLHHAYETYLHKEVTMTVLIMSTVFQFAFTTIFGWYVAFLFLRTGSVWPPTFVHMFCNSLGPPQFGRLEGNIRNTYIYRAFLIVGSVGFFYALYPWTKSENAIW